MWRAQNAFMLLSVIVGLWSAAVAQPGVTPEHRTTPPDSDEQRIADLVVASRILVQEANQPARRTNLWVQKLIASSASLFPPVLCRKRRNSNVSSPSASAEERIRITAHIIERVAPS